MSAIAGLMDKRGQRVKPADLGKMSAALAKHGPDGEGVWCKNSAGLLHRQRRVMPEDDGDAQPVVSPDGRIVLVSAARIDNRPELASELSFANREAESLPDSAFVLEAYQRWGADCPGHLIGDFSFALWDDREQWLLLACSPFSGRPLFYHDSSKCFAFATMPKGLFALPDISRSLNEDFLACSLARLPRPPEATVYRDIKKLLPGHRMIVQNKDIDARSFWEPDGEREIHYGRDEDYIDAFNDLWTRVVRDHMRAAGPVGIMLSGGLDSSSIAAVAAPLLQNEGKRLATFTEVPRAGFQLPASANRYANETPFVQAIAEMYPSIDLHLVRAEGRHFLQDLAPYFHHAETPFRNACNRLWLEAILREAQGRGIRVLLAGLQGNLSLSWRGEHTLPHLLRRGQWSAARREAGHLARNGQAGSPLRALIRQGLLPLLPTPIRDAVAWIKEARGSHPELKPVLRAEYARQHGMVAQRRRQDAANAPQSALESRRQRLKVMRGAASAAAPIFTGYEAMFGVEVRDPTSDVRLVEFCLA
ncbi:MAG: asparagine synthase-related protein, partial [Armatimonadota bacterium]|nr:asparagine synthase-related protein [Armatimonadota bacterium]